MNSYTRQKIIGATHDTDIRDFYVPDSVQNDRKLFKLIKSSLCKNLHNSWILSSHGKEETRTNQIKLKPGEIVIIPKNPGMPIPVDAIVDKYAQSIWPIDFFRKVANRKKISKKSLKANMGRMTFDYAIDYALYSGDLKGTVIPNLKMYRPMSGEFYTGLFKLPIQKGDKCSIDVKKTSILSYYIGKLRKQSPHGFVLYVSACRAPEVMPITIIGEDCVISKESTYEDYRSKAFLNPLSARWYGLGFPMRYLTTLLDSIVSDTSRGDLGCIGNLSKDKCTGIDYKAKYLEERGLDSNDVDKEYFEMMGFDTGLSANVDNWRTRTGAGAGAGAGAR